MVRSVKIGKPVFSWALYDWANSAFATTVMAGFFPLFFKQYWNAGVPATESTFRLGVANSVASLVVVLMAPVIGAIGDYGGGRKRFLAAFASLGVLTTGALLLVSQDAWELAAILYALGIIGFSGGNVFYDALLVVVAEPERRDRVSALGFSLGYLGGGLLFAGNVYLTLNPGVLGLSDASEAVRWSFASVAVWWAVFSIPLFVWVKEPDGRSTTGLSTAVRGGLRQLGKTIRELRELRTVFRFLLAYWLYIDGVDTIVRMAVDYGLALGFDANSLIVALLIVQFVGFPAAIVFGMLGERIGAKAGIQIAIVVYILVTIFAYHMDSSGEFYVLAIVIGLVQGGIQALSRSFYSRLIPQDRAAEFFGFYNMLGKFAAVIGPLMVGWVGVLSGDPRLGILSVALLFIVGGLVLGGVRDPARCAP